MSNLQVRSHFIPKQSSITANPHDLLYRKMSLPWRHNRRDSVSNHQPHDCLLNRLFRHRSTKASKLRVTGLCARIPRTNGQLRGKCFHLMTSSCHVLCISVMHWCSLLSLLQADHTRMILRMHVDKYIAWICLDFLSCYCFAPCQTFKSGSSDIPRVTHIDDWLMSVDCRWGSVITA